MKQFICILFAEDMYKSIVDQFTPTNYMYNGVNEV